MEKRTKSSTARVKRWRQMKKDLEVAMKNVDNVLTIFGGSRNMLDEDDEPVRQKKQKRKNNSGRSAESSPSLNSDVQPPQKFARTRLQTTKCRSACPEQILPDISYSQEPCEGHNAGNAVSESSGVCNETIIGLNNHCTSTPLRQSPVSQNDAGNSSRRKGSTAGVCDQNYLHTSPELQQLPGSWTDHNYDAGMPANAKGRHSDDGTEDGLKAFIFATMKEFHKSTQQIITQQIEKAKNEILSHMERMSWGTQCVGQHMTTRNADHDVSGLSLPIFPICDIEEFDVFESNIQQSPVFAEMVKTYLRRIGGTHTSQCVKHILKGTLSLDVQVQFTAQGKGVKGKRSMSDTQLLKLTLDVICERFPQYNRETMKKEIYSILRHVPERIKTAQNRGNNVTRNEASELARDCRELEMVLIQEDDETTSMEEDEEDV